VFLRHLDRTRLFQHIRQFLDLPPAPSSVGDMDELLRNQSFGSDDGRIPTIKTEDFLPQSDSPYASTGPPKTHPSAGLSYLRTSSHIFNHPIHGPQAHPTPVQGRVIQPKNSAIGSFSPKLGVGGFVTDVPTGLDSFNTTSTLSRYQRGNNVKPAVPGLINIEPEKVGGSKVYLDPKSASIDPKGNTVLEVSLANETAVSVHEGTVGEIPAELKRPVTPPRPFEKLKVTTTPQHYGLSASDAFEAGAQAHAARSWAIGGDQGPDRKNEQIDALKELESALAAHEKEPQ